jgi:hypothetical protein
MDEKTKLESIYQIRIRGIIDISFADWLGNISLIPQENNETLLIAQFPDQAALRGLLDQLWNLNFTLLAIEQIDPENDSAIQDSETEERQE